VGAGVMLGSIIDISPISVDTFFCGDPSPARCSL
jgi:hypothetical protein